MRSKSAFPNGCVDVVICCAVARMADHPWMIFGMYTIRSPAMMQMESTEATLAHQVGAEKWQR